MWSVRFEINLSCAKMLALSSEDSSALSLSEEQLLYPLLGSASTSSMSLVISQIKPKKCKCFLHSAPSVQQQQHLSTAVSKAFSKTDQDPLQSSGMWLILERRAHFKTNALHMKELMNIYRR